MWTNCLHNNLLNFYIIPCTLSTCLLRSGFRFSPIPPPSSSNSFKCGHVQYLTNAFLVSSNVSTIIHILSSGCNTIFHQPGTSFYCVTMKTFPALTVIAILLTMFIVLQSAILFPFYFSSWLEKNFEVVNFLFHVHKNQLQCAYWHNIIFLLFSGFGLH